MASITKTDDVSSTSSLEQPKEVSFAEMLKFETTVASLAGKFGPLNLRIGEAEDAAKKAGWGPKASGNEKLIAAMKTDRDALVKQRDALGQDWSVLDRQTAAPRAAISKADGEVFALRASVKDIESRPGASIANRLPTSELSKLKVQLRAAEAKVSDLKDRFGPSIDIWRNTGLKLGKIRIYSDD